MKKFLFLITLMCALTTLRAQDTTKAPRVLYIVDSIPVIDDPEDGSGTLDPNDVDELQVITNKSEIEKLGYKEVDKILLITTKEFKARPDSVKKIPSTKSMDRREGVWYIKYSDKPYSGRFIDYFWNGKKQGEGTLKNGVVDGLRTVYFQNGGKSFFRNYINGIANGNSEEYFPDGKLKQKGTFKDGLDDGLWVDYYSTGTIKRQMLFKDKKPQFGPNEQKFYDLLEKGKQLMKDDDLKGAIRKFDDAIKINPDYSDAYFDRGTAKLDDLNFDNAIADLDKAIVLEPLYKEAIANRAFARLRKYQLKNAKTLSKNSEVTIMTSPDKVDIPKEEKEKICADLNRSYDLGDRNSMITDAIKDFCTK